MSHRKIRGNVPLGVRVRLDIAEGMRGEFWPLDHELKTETMKM